MIIVKLMGGLGNQMFQYAAARHLACRYDTELKLDISFLEQFAADCTPRRFVLKSLNINAAIASPREVDDLTGQGKSRLDTLLIRFRRVAEGKGFQPQIYREPHFHFDPAFLNTPDGSYLEGYWQSEKYFQDISDLVRREFVVRDPMYGENLGISEQIRTTNSVSLHVRRGDYVSNRVTRETHGVCGMDYYQRCIAEISKAVVAPHFYLFSDDPLWVAEHVRLSFPMTLIDHNRPENGHEDLRLMSLCRHNIIANSSFSWWGAWLNANPGKIVIAPHRWFYAPSIDSSDVLPSSWIRL